jgi:hypothetical protein
MQGVKIRDGPREHDLITSIEALGRSAGIHHGYSSATVLDVT